MSEVSYVLVDYIRYELESESGSRVLIIPNTSGFPDMKNVLCLSDTSLEIWELIVKGDSNLQIINALCVKYSKAKHAIANDVNCFINDLKKNGFIRENNKNND